MCKGYLYVIRFFVKIFSQKTMDYLARESLIKRSLVVRNVRVWLPLTTNVAFNLINQRLLLTPFLVLPNVTCLQKGDKMHTQIEKGIVIFQEDILMAIQVVVCKNKRKDPWNL